MLMDYPLVSPFGRTYQEVRLVHSLRRNFTEPPLMMSSHSCTSRMLVFLRVNPSRDVETLDRMIRMSYPCPFTCLTEWAVHPPSSARCSAASKSFCLRHPLVVKQTHNRAITRHRFFISIPPVTCTTTGSTFSGVNYGSLYTICQVVSFSRGNGIFSSGCCLQKCFTTMRCKVSTAFLGDDTSARSALDESKLKEIGLMHLLDGRHVF